MLMLLPQTVRLQAQHLVESGNAVYQITIGPEVSTSAYGWGTDSWGSGTWGTPSTVSNVT